MNRNNTIPSEANRYDGAPAPDPPQPAPPSQEEIQAENRRRLQESGCKDCDETDPDNLDFHLPDVPGGEYARVEEIVLCDDCAEKRNSADQE